MRVLIFLSPPSAEQGAEVGTRLYIAPEVMLPFAKTLKKAGEKRNRVVHPKADIYSAGVSVANIS